MATNLKIQIKVITAGAKAAVKAFRDSVTNDFKAVETAAEKAAKEVRNIGKAANQASGQTAKIGEEAKTAQSGFLDASKAAEVFQGVMTKILIPIAIITLFFNMGKKIHAFFEGAINGADRYRKSLQETTKSSHELVKSLRFEGVDASQKKVLDQLAQFYDLQSELDAKLLEDQEGFFRGLLRARGVTFVDQKSQREHDKESAKLQKDRIRALEIIAGQRKKELEIAIALNKEDQKSKILTQIDEIDELRKAEAEASDDFIKAQEIEEKLENARHQKRIDQIAKERNEQVKKNGPPDSEDQARFDEAINNEIIIFDLRMRNIEAETTERERKALELIEKETEKRLEAQKKLEEKMLEAAAKAAEKQAEELEKELERISDSLLGLFGDGAFGDLTLLVQGLADVKNAIENGSSP